MVREIFKKMSHPNNTLYSRKNAFSSDENKNQNAVKPGSSQHI